MNNFGTDSTTNHAGITLSAEQNDTCTAFTDSIACDSATYCSVVIPEEKEDTSHVSTHMLDHDEGWWADSTYYMQERHFPTLECRRRQEDTHQETTVSSPAVCCLCSL